MAKTNASPAPCQQPREFSVLDISGSMTLKNRSRSPAVELIQAPHEIHVWCEFEPSMSNCICATLCTTCLTKYTVDLEIKGQGQGHHIRKKSPGLVTMCMQYLVETPAGHRIIAKKHFPHSYTYFSPYDLEK